MIAEGAEDDARVRVILDTNVFIAGVFFGGHSRQIWQAFAERVVQLVVTDEIVGEYASVGGALARHIKGIDFEAALDMIDNATEQIVAPRLDEHVCEDPDDDKFLACAIAASCDWVVSNDRHLLDVSGYQGVEVVRPRVFVESSLDGRIP